MLLIALSESSNVVTIIIPLALANPLLSLKFLEGLLELTRSPVRWGPLLTSTVSMLVRASYIFVITTRVPVQWTPSLVLYCTDYKHKVSGAA